MHLCVTAIFLLSHLQTSKLLRSKNLVPWPARFCAFIKFLCLLKALNLLNLACMIPPGEKIVETKKCRLSGKEFFVTDKDLEFYDKISPVFAWQKYPIPSPTLCPEERMRRRLVWRNERGLSFSSIEKELSMFKGESWYISYQPKKYWSDDWTPFDYVSDFDFSKSAFSQFCALDKKVPKLARSVVNEENCNYINQAGHMKDCYLVFNWEYSEKCYFWTDLVHAKYCLDFLWVNACEFCYEIVDCIRCNNLFFSQNCMDCRDAYFLYSCFDCHHCFWCINLAKKEYCFFNEQLSQGEYQRRLWEFSIEHHLKAIQEKKRKFFSTQFFREHQNQKSENIFGNKIFESQNVFNSYYISGSRDIHYCEGLYISNHDFYDVSSFWLNSSFCFESTTVGFWANNLSFCVECWDDIGDLLYCLYCNKWIKNCFLCTGLKQRAEHCIMNKPYSIQEYEILCWKIIDHMRSTGEWWEFFPHEFSPFGYNETVAQEYFPMTEAEVKAKWWNWYDEPPKTFEGATITPLAISQYDEKQVGYDTAQKNIDVLLSWVMQCEVTKKPFKIIKQELVFYIEHQLPIPTKHPDQRHKERMALRNPRELHERNCSECRKAITTTYSPSRPEKVVCENCYRKLVF